MKFLDELKDEPLVGKRVLLGAGLTKGTVKCRYRENVKILWDDETVSFWPMKDLHIV
jgi:hypothetical protein